MTSQFLNSSSSPSNNNNNNNNSPFHGGLNEDNHHDHHHHHHHHHQHHLIFGPYPQVAASSSSYSCHFYFNSAQDQAGYYHPTEICHPLQPIDQGNGYTSHGGSYESENKVGGGGDCVKLSPEIKVRGNGDQAGDKNNNPAKWMSSKMRLMQKMKKTDCRKGFDEIANKNATIKRTRQDQKQPSTNSMETDYSSNSSSNNTNTTSTTATPIRVCADCNTTKTPLWRSGPKGPKSLCNACGIRQRKARRALAAAAAAANDAPQPTTETQKVKIKVHHKEKTKNSTGQLTVPFKKRCKVTAASSHQQQEAKKVGFEDYLVKLSKNLAFHHVFPQDEKEAAILLMALSCGLVHG